MTVKLHNFSREEVREIIVAWQSYICALNIHFVNIYFRYFRPHSINIILFYFLKHFFSSFLWVLFRSCLVLFILFHHILPRKLDVSPSQLSCQGFCILMQFTAKQSYKQKLRFLISQGTILRCLAYSYARSSFTRMTHTASLSCHGHPRSPAV